MDVLFMVFYIAMAFLPLVAVGLVAWVVVVWLRRGKDGASEDGGSIVRRIYFYVVSFASLMMWVNGVVLLAQFALDGIFGGALISASNTGIAAGIAITVVGLPLWAFHWRSIQRAAADAPAEVRSIFRKLYIYITLGVSLAIAVYAAVRLLRWALGVDDFNGYYLAAPPLWALVWAFHWRIEEREGQQTTDALIIRRLYIYAASLAGMVMLALGVGMVAYYILLEGYNAVSGAEILSGERGLWRPALRGMLCVAAVGGGVWWLHWLHMARRDRGSELRQVYLYLFAIFGGVITSLSAAGVIIRQTLVWIFEAIGDGTQPHHFDFLPGSIAALSVGVALWAYHWRSARDAAAASTAAVNSSQRIYNYILAGIGTATLAVAVYMLVNTLIRLILAVSESVIVGSDLWASPIANIITLGALGVPIWGYYWRKIQRSAARDANERRDIARRIFIFAALGVGVLSLLGSVSALLFVLLRDLLNADLYIETLDAVAAPLAIVAATAAFLPYYWAVYAQDRAAAPETPPAETAPPSKTTLPADAATNAMDAPVPAKMDAPTPAKEVTLLAGGDADALIQGLQAALGYPVSMLRWADADAATPALSDDACAQIAQRVADAAGRRVLLAPEGDGLRVLSYE